MKYLLLVVGIATLTACNNDRASELKGNWKTYKVNYGGKDISKSSDPTNENGLWFDGTSNYRRFGNLGHRDSGKYTFKDNRLNMKAEKDSSNFNALVDLQADTLHLLLPLEGDDTLKMSLYKMAE